MEYECSITPINKLYSNYNKMITPLCTKCKNKGCSNPIMQKKISIMGIVYTTKLYCSGNFFFFVTNCDGFSEMEDDIEEKDNDV